MRTEPSPFPSPSPLTLCDSLLRLAQDADRAGRSTTAGRLVHLAFEVLDEPLSQGSPHRTPTAKRPKASRNRGH